MKSLLRSTAATKPLLFSPVNEYGAWAVNRAGVTRSSHCSHRSRTNRAGRRGLAGRAGVLRRGESSVSIRDASIAVPEVHEDAARGPLALGVRPEHVTLSDVAPIRGRVFGTEYLGTNQIVTVDIEQGQIKARVPTRLPVRIGETVGLAFQPEHLVVFDAATGRATQSALYEDNGHG